MRTSQAYPTEHDLSAVEVQAISRCGLIDAADIWMLVDPHRQVRRHDSRFFAREPTAQVRRLLRITQVDQILDVIPDKSAANETPIDQGRS